MLIYILEDDDNIRELETYALQNSGYETQGFAEPKYFHTAIQKQLPDLILLDMMLPDEDGHINSLHRKLKEKGALIVTVRNVGYKLKKGD